MNETKAIPELKEELFFLDSLITATDRVICTKPQEKLSALIISERGLRRKRQALSVQLHCMENKIVDMGKRAVFGTFSIPRNKTNQYSN